MHAKTLSSKTHQVNYFQVTSSTGNSHFNMRQLAVNYFKLA